MYELYVKTDCDFCKKAIELLSAKKIPFIVTVVDKNPEFLEKKKEQYGWTTVPLVVKFGENETKFIGGFSELEKEFIDDNKE